MEKVAESQLACCRLPQHWRSMYLSYGHVVAVVLRSPALASEACSSLFRPPDSTRYSVL